MCSVCAALTRHATAEECVQLTGVVSAREGGPGPTAPGSPALLPVPTVDPALPLTHACVPLDGPELTAQLQSAHQPV